MKEKTVNLTVLFFTAVALSSCATSQGNLGVASGSSKSGSNRTKIVQQGNGNVANVTNVIQTKTQVVNTTTYVCGRCGTKHRGNHTCKKQPVLARRPTPPQREYRPQPRPQPRYQPRQQSRDCFPAAPSRSNVRTFNPYRGERPPAGARKMVDSQGRTFYRVQN